MPNLDNNELPHWVDPSAYDRHVDTCEGYGPAPDLLPCGCERRPGKVGRKTCVHDEIVRPCSMCGETTHTERERTDDGEWDEDCVFRPFIDRDGNDRRNNNPRS